VSILKPVVVDTNILLSALLRSRSRIAEILFKPDREFYICEFAIAELFRHKERILKSSHLDEHELVEGFHKLIRKVILYKEDFIPLAHVRAADALCSGVDPDDMPHVALTLALDGLLWTGDRRLRRGLEERGFNRFFDPAA
jgi:predicted nucleic acid-binding protein